MIILNIQLAELINTAAKWLYVCVHSYLQKAAEVVHRK